MNLSAPKNTTFYVAVALAVLGFLGTLVQIPFVTGAAFWFVLVGFVVLALGVFLNNL
ncbi:MAG: hypothetical protein ABFS03_06730 [Chloroflexota bacterium]